MKKKRRVILLIFALLIAGAIKAEAVLDITFKEGASNKDLAINQIQYYWSDDASGANQNSRIINPDPTISFDLADPNKQAKTAYEAPPTDKYVFGASATYLNSGTTRVRVWDTAAQSDGGKYTDLASYTNPFGSGSSQNFSIVYKYIKANPGQGLIYKVDEVSSLVLPATKTTELKIYSTQVSVPGGIVEIAKCEWQGTYNGAPMDLSGQTGSTLTLVSSPTYPFINGDICAVKVRYQNIWGSWGNWSNEYSHVITGPVGTGPITSEVTFVTGLKFFSLGVPSIEAGTNKDNWNCSVNEGNTWQSIKTVDALLMQIEPDLFTKTTPSEYVSTFGIVTDQGVVEGLLQNGSIVDPLNFRSRMLSSTQGYQIVLKKDFGKILFRNQ